MSDLTRRGFFTRAAALVATTAMVPAAVAVLSEAERRAKLIALFEAASERARARMVAELTEEIWGKGSGDIGGLGELLTTGRTVMRYERKPMTSTIAISRVAFHG